jgi:hypothetical protein
MEVLIAAAVLLTIAVVAMLAPAFGVDSRHDEPTWPAAPLSEREMRRPIQQRNSRKLQKIRERDYESS